MNKPIIVTLNLQEDTILLNDGVLDALDRPRQVQILVNKDIDMKTSFKRLGAILMAVAILFSFTVAADAATVPTATIDTGRTGSIDIYKYDLTRANTDDAAAAMIDSYVSTGVRDTALEAVLDDGTVNNLGNGQQSYGYAVKGVVFSYHHPTEMCVGRHM